MQNSQSRCEFEQYRDEALRSEKPLQEVVTDPELVVETLKACIAMSAFADAMKKVMVYGRPLNYADLLEVAAGIYDRVAALYDYIACSDVEVPPTPSRVNVNPRLLHAELGTFGESGEVLSALLKQIQTGHLDISNLEEEDGDHGWYDALRDSELAALGAAPKRARRLMNVAKLRARYPEKFSLAASEGRDTDAERQAMERAREAA